MRIRLSAPRPPRLTAMAYTLVEVVIGVAIVGITFVSLYAGMSGGFAVTQLSRENLRATQIMLERMEGLRLYNWNQLCYSNAVNPGYLPTRFTNYYYPLATNGESKGIMYVGTLTITNVNLVPAASYGANMRRVTVSISWDSGGVTRTRTMSTYASRNGLQNYVYNN
jgi:type II secretory pathway pseudopilin PulG